MAKKKVSNTYNIDTLNVEIDYEKLAEAIVKADRSSKRQRMNFRSRAMRFLNGIVYLAIFIAMGGFISKIWQDYYPAGNIPLWESLFLSLIFGSIAFYAFLCHQESLGDNREDSLLYFNSNMSLVALVVALLALFREGF